MAVHSDCWPLIPYLYYPCLKGTQDESEISNRFLDWHVAMSQVAKILIINCSRTCEMETEAAGYRYKHTYFVIKYL